MKFKTFVWGAIGVICLFASDWAAAMKITRMDLKRDLALSEGVWVVQVMAEKANPPIDCTSYDTMVVTALKGAIQSGTLVVCTVSKNLVIGRRYLVFGRAKTSDNAWIDNGAASPVELSKNFKLPPPGTELLEVIEAIYRARIAQLDLEAEPYLKEKTALSEALPYNECEGNLVPADSQQAAQNWKVSRYLCGLKAFSNKNYTLARKFWNEILNVDPSYADAKARIARLDKLAK